jgi:hypothetical protein
LYRSDPVQADFWSDPVQSPAAPCIRNRAASKAAVAVFRASRHPDRTDFFITLNAARLIRDVVELHPRVKLVYRSLALPEKKHIGREAQ